jgi:hypothetical protein
MCVFCIDRTLTDIDEKKRGLDSKPKARKGDEPAAGVTVFKGR